MLQAFGVSCANALLTGAARVSISKAADLKGNNGDRLLQATFTLDHSWLSDPTLQACQSLVFLRKSSVDLQLDEILTRQVEFFISV